LQKESHPNGESAIQPVYALVYSRYVYSNVEYFALYRQGVGDESSASEAPSTVCVLRVSIAIWASLFQVKGLACAKTDCIMLVWSVFNWVGPIWNFPVQASNVEYGATEAIITKQ
jgi:hypothetical protein